MQKRTEHSSRNGSATRGYRKPSGLSSGVRFLKQSEMCFGRASRPCPPMSTMRPPCDRHMSPRCVRSLSAVLCHMPALLSARVRRASAQASPCLLWGRAVASSSRILFHLCATHSVYFARLLVGFLGILAPQISACASAPYAWKTVWGLCWYNSPNSLLWSSLIGKKNRLTALSTPSNHHVSARCPLYVCHVPTLWPRVSAKSPPRVRPCPGLCVGFGRAFVRSSPPCVRFCSLVSAMCRLFVCSLSAFVPITVKRKQVGRDKPSP